MNYHPSLVSVLDNFADYDSDQLRGVLETTDYDRITQVVHEDVVSAGPMFKQFGG